MGYIANRRDLLITGTTLTAATMLAVSARFWVRHRLRAKKGPDDWCALAAGIIFWVNNVAMWWGMCGQIIPFYLFDLLSGVINRYMGVDPLTMQPKQLEISLKMSFAGIFLMSTILTLCRLSVLFLYNRLFGIYPMFRKILIVYGVASLAWPITIWLGATFRCKPVKGSWDLTTNPQCAFSLETLFVSLESINAVLDVFLVIIPISKIKILQLPLREKIGLGIVFLMGGFVGLTSVFRIVFTYNPTKKGAVIDSMFWLWLQLATAIICACLPTLRTLLPTKTLFSPVSSTIRQLLGSKMKKSTLNSSLSGSNGQKSDRPKKSIYANYAISTRSDDEIALTGVSVDIRSMP
ncbi:hypothetical protein BDV95DRAFT_250987 [Massariosphaeria phaeospora]|uniref:Rhodopsin domain-containing protein n=1 Tax=Massariosphaeria phaeospora TaxID=100035 RepID=A0A7C8M069_9PLEO|nr:hypothetical protein BDV95DRAFT_250987 [Massariosphaeria phaeospora]